MINKLIWWFKREWFILVSVHIHGKTLEQAKIQWSLRMLEIATQSQLGLGMGHYKAVDDNTEVRRVHRVK